MVEYLGRYELLGEIATGGMAKVYLGRVVGEGGFEREVAVKVMHEHLASDPDFVAMFLDEARLAARIRHPNVVPTIDVQKTDEVMYLVMDFVEGLSLAAILKQCKKRNEPMPVEVALRVVADTLHGLNAAHELTDRDGKPLNLVHRDVSPANVLVGTDGVARITDFGVARAEARLTSTRGGQVKGKLQYMPPEQIIADEVDRRADVYAAGVVLWELLVGRRLFNAQHEGALLQQVLNGAPTSPSQENSAIPKAIDAVCMKALSVDPGTRYPTAVAFAEEIEEAARTAGLRVANVQKVATFVRTFETNATRIAEARKAAPAAPPGDIMEAISQSGGAGLDPLGAMELSSGSVDPNLGRMAGEHSHSVAMQLQQPPRRTGIIAGVAIGMVVAGVGIIGFVSGMGRDRAPEPAPGANPPVVQTVFVQQVAAPTATVEPPPPPTVVPTATATAEATAEKTAAPVRPGGGGRPRPPATSAPTAKPKSTSAVDYIPPVL